MIIGSTMNRLSALLFAALLVVSIVFTLKGIAETPESIAIHFSTTGEPDRWIERDYYRLLILLVLVGLPFLLVWVMGILPRYTYGRGQIPDPGYWFAEERRDSTKTFLISHACLLAWLFDSGNRLWTSRSDITSEREQAANISH
jgi:uncharacterized membrane protein